MKVHVRLFSTLAEFSPSTGGEFILNMTEADPVSRIPEMLKMPAAVQRVILVNGRHAKPPTVLSEGDRVTIFPPMTGG